MTAQRTRTACPGTQRPRITVRQFIAATTSVSLVAGVAATGLVISATASSAEPTEPLYTYAEETETDARDLLSPAKVAKESRKAQKNVASSTQQDDSLEQKLAAEDPLESVTTIIQFDEGVSASARDKTVENLLVDLRKQAQERGLSQQEVQAIEVVQEYDTTFSGVAITMPRFGQTDVDKINSVKNSFVEQRYEIPQDQPVSPLNTESYTLKNESSLAMTGAQQSTKFGDDMLISIVDTGLDVEHEAFADTLDEDTLRYSQEEIDELRPELGQGKDASFISNKVPFAYDYADGDNNVDSTAESDMSHGTHVAGIAAANGGETIRGTAPNAQIMVQKVFSDTKRYASDSWILAALEDAAVLEPDVINMSLGSSAGFGTADSAAVYGDVFSRLRDEGIILSVSAGNNRQAAVNNASGKNLPFATDPDYGILGSPSAISPNLSVASINNSLARPYLRGSDGYKAYFSPLGSADGSIPSFAAVQEGTYSYVSAGLGSAADIAEAMAQVAEPERAQTIVLIRRGSFSFQEKVTNAQAFGPAAIIIMDNADSPDFINPAVNSSAHPVAVVTKATGDALVAASQKSLSVSSAFIDDPDQNFRASTFSSMGVTPELQLKPDVAAPGGNIYSAVPGGYDWKSGTSMAAPQIAGIIAIVKEHLLDNEDEYGDLSEEEASDLAQILTVNTALPLKNPLSAGHTYYTPRKQGAGLANVPAAQRTPTYLTVKKTIDATRPTASLGESRRGTYTFSFTAHNLSEKTHKYSLDATALSDTIQDGLFKEESTDYTNKGLSVRFSGKHVRGKSLYVPAGKSTTVKVRITADKRFRAAVKEASNGTFIDGFVRLTSSSNPALTIPFVGFYGDWSQVPVFDAPAVSGNAHISGSVLYNTTFKSILGVNPLDPQGTQNALTNPSATIKTERYVLSPVMYGGKPNEVQPLTGLLRNVSTLTYDLKDTKNTKVSSHSYDYVRKSFYYASEGFVTTAESFLDTPPRFTAFNSSGNLLSAGKHVLQQTARTVGPRPQNQRVSTPLTVDLSGPQVEGVQLVGEGADKKVRIQVSDDTYLSALTFHADSQSGFFEKVLTTDTAYQASQGRHLYEVVVPVAQLEKTYAGVFGQEAKLPEQITVYAWDYGLSRSVPLQVDTAQVIAP
ncbi:S8 family serine peptidase [Timonella sp. A28]|uniref:S8 family serine peptidase n=1 Tax=Timonella sp. A28 TaxID=3442640 RepID=UPI003EBC27DA